MSKYKLAFTHKREGAAMGAGAGLSRRLREISHG